MGNEACNCANTSWPAEHNYYKHNDLWNSGNTFFNYTVYTFKSIAYRDAQIVIVKSVWFNVDRLRVCHKYSSVPWRAWCDPMVGLWLLSCWWSIYFFTLNWSSESCLPTLTLLLNTDTRFYSSFVLVNDICRQTLLMYPTRTNILFTNQRTCRIMFWRQSSTWQLFRHSRHSRYFMWETRPMV